MMAMAPVAAAPTMAMAPVAAAPTMAMAPVAAAPTMAMAPVAAAPAAAAPAAAAPTMMLVAPSLLNRLIGTIGEHFAQKKNPRILMAQAPGLAPAPAPAPAYAAAPAPAYAAPAPTALGYLEAPAPGPYPPCYGNCPPHLPCFRCHKHRGHQGGYGPPPTTSYPPSGPSPQQEFNPGMPPLPGKAP